MVWVFCLLLTFYVLDMTENKNMSLGYIMLKSAGIGILFFMYAMSSTYSFDFALTMSLFIMSINFFLNLIVYLAIFLLYLYGKNKRYIYQTTFAIGYVAIYYIFINLKTYLQWLT